jgi:hypothetical protein
MKMHPNQSSALSAPIVVPLIGAFVLLAGCASGPSSRMVTSPPPPPPGTANAPATVVVPTTTTSPQTVTTTPTIIVQQAPPAVQAESPSARPSSRHVWVGGYWLWQNRQYNWVAGHWAVPPEDGANWIPPRWEREGNSYRFYDGYWD